MSWGIISQFAGFEVYPLKLKKIKQRFRIINYCMSLKPIPTQGLDILLHDFTNESKGGKDQ